MTSTHYRLGLILVITSALAWSTAGLFARALPLDSATMLTWRGFYGAIGIAAMILVTERRRALVGFYRMGWQGWLFVLVSMAGMIFYITSLNQTSVAHVSVIYASVPFVAAGLGWVFIGETPSRNAMLASLAALVGIAVMVGWSVDGTWFGDLLAFGMTVCMAMTMVMARRYQSIPFIPAACLSALISGVVCLPFSQPVGIATDHMLLLALFGLVNSALGFGLFAIGARLLPAIETALIGALDAPLAPLWVWIVFAEVPGASTIVGGIIVFVAVALYLVSAARRQSRMARILVEPVR